MENGDVCFIMHDEIVIYVMSTVGNSLTNPCNRFLKDTKFNMKPILLILIVVGLTDCTPKLSIEVREDFVKYYDYFGVKGSFVLYDEQENKYVFYNRAQSDHPFTPASTYKICNSLIGVETGVIKDDSFLIAWDSIVRNPIWDKDHDLKTAFANSAVWYYRELAKRVGPDRMKYWLDKADYGNSDTSGGLDQFWLTGGLRISPAQQLDFLRRI